MAANPTVSKIQDKEGVTYDIGAERLANVTTFQLTGDVVGTSNSDLSNGLSISTDIAADAVTEVKIKDGAVTTNKIADGAVTLVKISGGAKGSVSDSDDAAKLATCGDVKQYVDGLISGQGSYLGKKTVAQINALTGLHNSDRVHVTDSGKITDGNITVRKDEDLIYYTDGTTHRWESMDGEFKLKQTAYTASGLSTGKTITSVTQDTNGVISVTATDISITKSQISDFAHNHDDRYYTKTEVDGKLDDEASARISGDSAAITISQSYTDESIASEVVNRDNAISVAINNHHHSGSDIEGAVAEATHSVTSDKVDVTIGKSGYLVLTSPNATGALLSANMQLSYNVSGTESVLNLGDGMSHIGMFTAEGSKNGEIVSPGGSVQDGLNKWELPNASGVIALVGHTHEVSDIDGLSSALDGKASSTHTHSVKINGQTKTIPASGSEPVDLGTYLTSSDISGKEDKSNKVTAWSATTNNTRYPSEKLVKDSLDAEASARISGDSGTLATAQSYTDESIDSEITNRNNAIAAAIAGLDSSATGTGVNVNVTVTEVDGLINSVSVVDNTAHKDHTHSCTYTASTKTLKFNHLVFGT